MNVNPFSYLIEKLKSKADKGESAPPTDNSIPANADLNDYGTVGFYKCGGGNAVVNKPTGVGAFGLIVIHSASGAYYEQRLTDSNSRKTYVRYGVSGTWGSWGTIALTSDIGNMCMEYVENVSFTFSGSNTSSILTNSYTNIQRNNIIGIAVTGIGADIIGGMLSTNKANTYVYSASTLTGNYNANIVIFYKP